MQWKPLVAGCTLAIALAASAAPASASAGIAVDYKLTVHTHIKKMNQDVTVKHGRMHATVALDTGNLRGNITLPPATTTTYVGGIGALTATFQMQQAKPVKGHIDFATLKVRATSVFNIKIVSAYAGPIPINLVGNSCTTVTPVSVTMTGTASFTTPSTFKGTYTIPKFKNCAALTPVLNQLIPGPGNSFVAVASPA